MKLEWRFSNFLKSFTICFLNFSGNAPACVGHKRQPKQNFVFPLSVLSRPGLVGNEARMIFFFQYFWECSSSSQVETVPGTKFFFLSFGLSMPDFTRNQARITFFFFKFFEFLYYLFWIVLGMHRPMSGKICTWNEKVFFFVRPGQVWLEMKLEWFFWIFLGML